MDHCGVPCYQRLFPVNFHFTGLAWMAVYSYASKLGEEDLGTLEQISVSIFFPGSRQTGGSWYSHFLDSPTSSLTKASRSISSCSVHAEGNEHA